MSDLYKDNNDYNNDYNNDEYTPQDTTPEKTEDIFSSSEPTAQESSYEWNSGVGSNTTNNDIPKSTEYHYSYVNGNNETASHNPNNYENAYSSSNNTGYTSNSYNTSQPYTSVNTSANPQQSDYSQPRYTSYQYNPQNTTPYQQAPAPTVKKAKVKKPKKPLTRGFIAAMLVITVLASATLGFAGGYIANNLNTTSNGSININKVYSDNTSKGMSVTAGTTSEIVKKTADSVVEIATESVVTGSFAQQYIQQGAGSGVIISEDGYIITNYHVIEGANNITVTLRDGTTSYTAAIIGSDEENDIALLKVDATGLSPATFGDSSTLAVGDYVVAIGNPLGELGGTVTDGIISALAREVTIEGQDMTLLQTNAQISPGNSGGGLFNANGELVGIVNAKDSATEVEGIAFAIPINNVLDIINDLKTYGYVTGKVELGMQLADITSKETAFYYGVNQTGCYVLSVTRGSNAEMAGFRTGDIITKVNGTEVTSSDDVNKALEEFEVGDQVTFTVYRSGQTTDLKLTLAEYVPSGNVYGQSATTPAQDDYIDDIWSQMFGW